MPQGAVFKLVLRDERFDKFFTASDFLKDRLKDIEAMRAAGSLRQTAPTFTDIEKSHLLYIRSSYKPYVNIASEYSRTKASGDGTAGITASGGTIQFTIPTNGHFTSDMAIHVKVKPIGTQEPTQDSPYFRYCALPGVKLFRKISLHSDQVLIDEYTPDEVIAHSKFFVRGDQKIGWERCHGQQELQEALYDGVDFTGSFMYRNGLQTFKQYHEGFEMIIPLQFWFCKDVAHALLNEMTSTSQRTITCELAPVFEILSSAATWNIGDGGGAFPNTQLPSSIGIEAELYVNSLYVNPEIYDIFASRTGFSLIRVHRKQVHQIQNPSDSFLLDQLKFPAEYLMVGIRDRTLFNDPDRWWLNGTRGTEATEFLQSFSIPFQMYDTASATTTDISLSFRPRALSRYSTLSDVVESIGVTAHGTEIFAPMPSLFYNAYMPLRYPENSMVVSPADKCTFLVNFCLYPGKFNPSGYYNLSAGREMYINYVLKPQFATAESGRFEMVILMSALNFIVRRGDHLHLRYSL